MRQTILLVVLLFLGAGYAQGQSRVTGRVTDATDGKGMPFVTVAVKGATIGTTTDTEGNYSISVNNTNATLVFSFVGYKNVELMVAEKNVINVSLELEATKLNEVVVTAMGITREKKGLGYSVSEVKGDEMQNARSGVANPINALAGKVAGLQITGGSGQMGGSSKILIRGNNSLSGNNQPLFIIDGVPIEGQDFNTKETARGGGGFDYGNLVQDINPDDIETLSVLKGPNASALYGSRASNGVVLITTKRGKKNQGWGVTFNSSLGFEVVNKLPRLQREYGGGGNQEFETASINNIEYNIVDYATDESWGPRLDGTQVLSWYDLARWEEGGKVGNPSTSAWSPSRNDVRSFFGTGTNLMNSVSIAQASDNASVRLSYTNSQMKGYMPNSSMQKNSVNINASMKPSDALEVFTNITYFNHGAKGRVETGYGDNNPMQKFLQWGQRQLDMKELKNLYRFSSGTQASWNRSAWDDPTPAYSNNPYWSRFMNYQNDNRNRIYGNVGAMVKFTDYLKLRFKSNLDFFSDKQYERNAVYSQEQSKYLERQRQQYELNNEFLLMYTTQFEDFSINANAGTNFMMQRYEKLGGETVGGLVIPEFYNLFNGYYTPKAENELRKKWINSAFASANIGYSGFLFLDLTLRNDWSSTLPQGHNSYIYPSVTGSFIFSEKLKEFSWLSLGKLRLGFAQVGNDTDPYRVADTYSHYTHFEGNVGWILPTEKNNKYLKPERTTSFELGLDLAFLRNRINMDLTFYSSVSRDQIMPLVISGTTGYKKQIVNAGSISNKGIEISLGGKPIIDRDFEWDVTTTLSSNKNKVVDLIDGLDYFQIASAPFKAEVGAYKGKEYGQIMGTDYKYLNGQRVVADGLYESTDGNVPLAKVFPNFIAGITNSFRYKNIDFSFLFDGQWGGHFFSTTYMWGIYSGMFEESAGKNDLGNQLRDDIAKGGGKIVSGVNSDGSPNTQRVDATEWAASLYSGPTAQSVMKSDFVKLREVSLGYTFKLKDNFYIKSLKVSAFGQNLLMWGPATKHFDPEMATTSAGNVQGIEGAILPSVASFGINVGIKF